MTPKKVKERAGYLGHHRYPRDLQLDQESLGQVKLTGKK
jgi:hypothetical protein